MTAGAVAKLIDCADVRPLTVDEFMRMAEVGILDPDERVELLAGMIVNMSPTNPPHSFAVQGLARRLTRTLLNAEVRVQDSVRLSAYSLPEPDIAVVRELGTVYAQRHPEPEDVLLIVEVSDSTLANDIKVKVPLYAAASVQDVWIVDLVHQRILVHRSPEGDHYASMSAFAPGQPVAPLAFPDVLIDPTVLF